MLDCYCDYDPATVYSRRTVRARKEYRCEECCGPIKVGEPHEYVFGVWDSCASSFRTCARCADLSTWVKNNVPCYCPVHGNLLDSMKEAIEDAYDRARDEVTGLWFGFQRRRILLDRYNRQARAH